MNYISPELQERLSKRAESHYTSDLAYHNWTHAEDVMTQAAQIAVRSTVPELVEKAPLLVIAAAWHDADYHLPDLGKFKTKEERSAELAVRSLPELTDEDRALLYSGIIDTTVAKTEKDTLFGHALHTADVGYFAEDYRRFLNRLTRMRKEWDSPSWDETVERTLKFGHHLVRESEIVLPKLLPAYDVTERIEAIQFNLAELEANPPK